MREQENVNLVKQIYDCFTKGDIQGLLSRLTDNIQLHEPQQGPPPFAGTYKGKTEVSNFFKQMNEISTPVTFEANEFIAQGSTVVALGHFKFHSKVTDRDWESDFSMVLRIENEKVSEMVMYKDSAAELKALQKEFAHT